MEADEGLVDKDVRIELSHLRGPFEDDLRGVILTAADRLIGDDGRPKPGVDDQVALEYLHGRIMNLVDLLLYEATNEMLRQTAEQLGGYLVEDELTLTDEDLA